MNYSCPTCGFPKMCGRLYRESFFFGDRLIDMPIKDSCRHCGSWTAIARVHKKNKYDYSAIEFKEIVLNRQ